MRWGNLFYKKLRGHMHQMKKEAKDQESRATLSKRIRQTYRAELAEVMTEYE